MKKGTILFGILAMFFLFTACGAKEDIDFSYMDGQGRWLKSASVCVVTAFWVLTHQKVYNVPSIRVHTFI